LRTTRALTESGEPPMKIAVLGTGFVGLTAAACFAESGHEVICIDNDVDRIKALNRGKIPFYEPDLAAMIDRNRQAGRLKFTTGLAAGIAPADLIFLTVEAPQKDDGSLDLSQIEEAGLAVARSLKKRKTVVIMSTVPTGTNSRLTHLMTGVTSI